LGNAKDAKDTQGREGGVTLREALSINIRQWI
jgi:hypothetical protein